MFWSKFTIQVIFHLTLCFSFFFIFLFIFRTYHFVIFTHCFIILIYRFVCFFVYFTNFILGYVSKTKFIKNFFFFIITFNIKFIKVIIRIIVINMGNQIRFIIRFHRPIHLPVISFNHTQINNVVETICRFDCFHKCLCCWIIYNAIPQYILHTWNSNNIRDHNMNTIFNDLLFFIWFSCFLFHNEYFYIFTFCNLFNMFHIDFKK